MAERALDQQTGIPIRLCGPEFNIRNLTGAGSAGHSAHTVLVQDYRAANSPIRWLHCSSADGSSSGVAKTCTVMPAALAA